MSIQLRTVVVGVGSIHEPDPVLAAAAAVARRAGAALHAVHVFALPEPMLDAYARMGYLDSGVFTRYGGEFEARLRKLAAEVAPDLQVKCHAIPGAASQALREVATSVGADLLVLGASHGGAMSRLFLGTTAESVIRTSRVPVLVLRARPEPLPRRVLVTTDVSAMSARVHEVGLDLAASIAGPEALEIRSLLVVAYDAVLPPPLRRDLLEEAAETEHARFVAQRAERPAPVARRVRFGDPAREIVAESAEWGADLVVLGTHARRGIARLLLGSVAGSVLRSAPCNVLVVPPVPGEPLGEGAGEPHESVPMPVGI
jgi:nucleotide-binding universal stress UspA family protein